MKKTYAIPYRWYADGEKGWETAHFTSAATTWQGRDAALHAAAWKDSKAKHGQHVTIRVNPHHLRAVK